MHIPKHTLLISCFLIIFTFSCLLFNFAHAATPIPPTLQSPGGQTNTYWSESNAIPSGTTNFQWTYTGATDNIWFYFYLLQWDFSQNKWIPIASEYTQTSTSISKFLADGYYAWQVAAVDIANAGNSSVTWYKWANDWFRLRLKTSSIPTPNPTPTPSGSPTPTPSYSLTPTPTPCATCPTFYIAPTGNDTTGDGSSAKPWKTFNKAIPQLDPGEILILKNGTYGGSTGTGYPNINCTAGAKNGTSAKPITIKAENERQAFLKGDGSTRPFQIHFCSYWTIEGLRAEGMDSQNEPGGGDAGHVFLAGNSSNLVFKRNLGTKTNRYENSHVFRSILSSRILYEENEAYDFHRHGISLQNSSFITLRRNYVNSRGYPSLPGGGGCRARRRISSLRRPRRHC